MKPYHSNLFVVFLFITVASSCKNPQNSVIKYIDVCDYISPEICSKSDSINMLVYNSTQIAYSIKDRGIEYSVCLNKFNKITRLYAQDKNFKLGNLKVGMPYSSIPKEFIIKEYYVEGFSYEVELKKGWEAHFWDDRIRDSSKIYEEAPIRYFLKTSDCE